MHKKNTLETLFKNNMLKLAVIRKVAGFVEARFGKKELIDILTDKDVNKNIENSMKVLLIKGNLNELSNLINIQNIELNYPKCSQCIFYSKGIMACMHPANEGMRVIDADNNTCDNVALEWNEDVKQKLEKSYGAN